MNFVRIFLALVLMGAHATLNGVGQGRRPGQSPRPQATYYLTIYSGKVNNRPVPSGGQRLKSRDRISATNVTLSAQITAPNLFASVTLAPGSVATVGSFQYEGDTVYYLNLLSGSLVYDDLSAVRGSGRKYIVRGRGRALGALGTEYSLEVPEDPKLPARLDVISGTKGVGWTRPGYYDPPDEKIAVGNSKEWY